MGSKRPSSLHGVRSERRTEMRVERERREGITEQLVGAFYWPSVQWVDHPALTLLPVLVFGAAVWRLRRTGRPCQTLLVMTMAWLVYAIYEGLMFVLALQVIVPVRIDLIVLGPLMYVITGVAVVSWWRAIKGQETY